MKMHGFRQKCRLRSGFDVLCWALPSLVAVGVLSMQMLGAQAIKQDSVAEQIQQLENAITHTQAQVEQSQRDLEQLRLQLAALQLRVAASGTNAADPAAPDPVQPSSATAQSSPEIEEIRERQTLQESQIATHEQTKVESESKYPVKITGLMLLNGFVNTRAVDVAATPTMALYGSGSSGAAVRQTVLGFDARGPHLFGASSSADLRVDFDGLPQSGTNAAAGAYSSYSTLLRLRTAHAALEWPNTKAYFALDRPILSPDAPSSLTAVAVPALAWSGNLWTWNPQVGVTRDMEFSGSHDLRLQAALIDVGDAPTTPVFTTQPSTPVSTAERSRWPGVQARVAVLGSAQENSGFHFGAGGYFSPHHIFEEYTFEAWAGTLDARVVLPGRLQLTATSYRGRALGGLGGGGYKDFVYTYNSIKNEYYFQPLDDTGGWAELKEKTSERLEFNGAFGLDNVFARELRPFAIAGGTEYQNVARNHTYTGNVIYSPSAYLLFSLEYRHLVSTPVSGASASSNIIGVGAGYKF